MNRFEMERINDLRKQHIEYLREGYDGHKRHSSISKMNELGRRRLRRMWNLRLKKAATDWNSDTLSF